MHIRLLVLLSVIVQIPVIEVAAAPFSEVQNAKVDYAEGRYVPKASCGELSATTTTEFSVISASSIEGICRVSGIIPGEIRFEINLPQNWNGRTLMFGNGGLAGQPASDPRITAQRDTVLAQNFVSVYSDNGHDARVEPGASFAYKNVAKLIDYGYRAVHLTQVTAEQLVRAYYQREAHFSYFMGCSNGGRQALMSAQRFPEDFDGIVAGAPANDFTGLKFSQAHRMRAILDSDMNLEKATALGEHILAACDAKDGLKDRLISDPTQCEFSPQQLPACVDGSPDVCFTKRDVEALHSFYAPIKVAGAEVYPAFPVGSEVSGPQSFGDYSGWMPWVINPSGRPILDVLGSEFFRYIVFVEDNPDLVWTDVDFTEAPDNLPFTRDVLDAIDPDLSRFKDFGGKLISYFGWADPDINPISTIDYHQQVNRTVSDVDDFYRLFMVPGMFHCAGGPGPSHFDAFTPLVDWVEKGIAPKMIPAAHKRQGETVYTRPLCPHPQQAVYTGNGEINDAESFRCE